MALLYYFTTLLWQVLESLKEKVDAMKKLMPLVGDLRNPAMRERHWKQLMEEVGKTFDPRARPFQKQKGAPSIGGGGAERERSVEQSSLARHVGTTAAPRG